MKLRKRKSNDEDNEEKIKLIKKEKQMMDQLVKKQLE